MKKKLSAQLPLEIPNVLTVEQGRALFRSCPTDKKGRLMPSKAIPGYKKKVLEPILSPVVTNTASGDKTYVLNINPIPKPRMVRSDKYKKRKITTRFWEFKDRLLYLANQQELFELPVSIKSIYFFIEVPPSVKGEERKNRLGKLHTQRPDLDNLLKALQDCLCKEDSHIAEIEHMKKEWATEGKIIIKL